MHTQVSVTNSMFLVKVWANISLILAFSSNIIATENIKHDDFDNTVLKAGDDFILAGRSEVYDMDYKLILVKEDDPLIFSEEDEDIFVVSHSSSTNRAFGSIKDGRFFGQFHARNTSFYIDHPEKLGKTGQAILYSAEDVLDDATKEGKFLNATFNHRVPQPLISRVKTKGNICRMRIIVDKYLLETFGNDKGRVRAMVKEHEMSLNEIYQVIEIRGKPFQFKVVDLEFHDDEFCAKNRNSVGCKRWSQGEDDKFLEEHAKRDHSDVCLTFLFTSHDFGSTLGVAYIGTVCSSYRPTIISNGQTAKLSANTGFITFDGKTFVPTSHLTFAHEVGHNMGSSHDGVGPTRSCPAKGYLMASFAPSRPTEENKRFSSCSLDSIKKAVQKLLKDPLRQCMVEQDHIVKPNPTVRPVTTRPDINIDIDRFNPVDTPDITEEEHDEAEASTSTLYIISGVVVILVIIIAFLLFCLCSKRDMSPCPTRSDFGRRYTHVRGNMRKSVMYLTRQVTLRRNGEEHQKLDTLYETDSQTNTPDFGRKFAPSRPAPTLPTVSSYVDNPAPYTTPPSQMIPKMKPKRPVVASGINQTSEMPQFKQTSPRFSPKGPQLNNNRNSPTIVPKRPESPKFSNQNSPFGSPNRFNKFEEVDKPKALFSPGQSNAFPYKPKDAVPGRGGLPNSPKMFLTPKKLDTNRWDRGQMSREESEDQLSGDLVGSFLVRTSRGQMVLSLKDAGRVKHIKLEEKNGQISGDSKVFFDDVQELIDYYKINPIPGTNNVHLR